MKQLIITLLTICVLGTTSSAQMAVLASDLVSPVGIESDAEGNHWVTDNGKSHGDGCLIW